MLAHCLPSAPSESRLAISTMLIDSTNVDEVLNTIRKALKVRRDVSLSPY